MPLKPLCEIKTETQDPKPETLKKNYNIRQFTTAASAAERNKQMKKRQTDEQRTMREFAIMVYEARPFGSSLRRVAREVWRIYPKGYASFERFYRSLHHLTVKNMYNR